MTPTTKFDVAKAVEWPGATPFFFALGAAKSLRVSGVAPGHVFALAAGSFDGFCHVICQRRIDSAFLICDGES